MSANVPPDPAFLLNMERVGAALGQDEIRAIVTGWAAGEPLIRRVYLFGSRARGDHKPDSDVDLAILTHVDTGGVFYPFGSREWRDRPQEPEIVAALRDDALQVNRDRWREELTLLLSVKADPWMPTRTDRVRRSLKCCRVLLYRAGMPI